MNFHEIRFPTALSFGSAGGPMRRTDIVKLASGFEERNTPWEHSRRQYDAGVGLRSLDDVHLLVSFFEARRGQLYGFRWKDWADYKSCKPSTDVSALDQEIGWGGGKERTFQLVKRYESGDGFYLRPIKKPVEGTVRAAVSGDTLVLGRDYDVDHSAGLITFVDPPDVGTRVTAGFEFDVPVRFDTDRISTAAANVNAGEVPSIPVIEVRI